MFSRSEKITTRPGVFRVLGVTQYFLYYLVILNKKWPKMCVKTNIAHQRNACCRLLNQVVVKTVRHFPPKLSKTDVLCKKFVITDNTAFQQGLGPTDCCEIVKKLLKSSKIDITLKKFVKRSLKSHPQP